MSQKDIFLASEGDAWFERNTSALARRVLPDDDEVLRHLLALGDDVVLNSDVAEVGCGEALRLAWLKRERHCRCAGVDPSAKAIEAARRRGIDARQGTADALPFPDSSVDILIFGFCLYLCDREDLFRVAAEANRVVRTPGWIVIQDFFSRAPSTREYHHRPGVSSHKMDYRSPFLWHPQYECVAHHVRHHATGQWTDDENEWVGVSVLRKHE